jgi:hypothetical protein
MTKLEVLQGLATIKLNSYKNKWSKGSDSQVRMLNSIFGDEEKLVKYFTKR